jgi:hypothetical protein
MSSGATKISLSRFSCTQCHMFKNVTCSSSTVVSTAACCRRVHTPPPEPQLQGAAPISFQPHEPRTTSFHKPFRRFLGRSHDSGDRIISSIYMSNPPSAFHTPSAPTTCIGQRRARMPPKFNLMVSMSSRSRSRFCGLTDAA